MGEHLEEAAALVAALRPDDQRRRRAEDHATRCVACREALNREMAFVALLKKAMESSTITPRRVDDAASPLLKGTT
jgi:hypothetical protein